MIRDPLAAIAVITSSAVLCQWLASRLNLPSVLFLLSVGVALSPILDPDELFGDLLFVGVGLGVAVLLFEGGTGLDWHRLRDGRTTVLRLVSVGALIAWVAGSVTAATVLDVPVEIAILIGAILIVSGPTVVMPLLRVVRPREPTGSILQWEGILIDPVGAGLAIVVLDAIIEERAWPRILIRVVTTAGAGVAVGGLVAAVVIMVMQRHLLSDHLHVPMTLAAVIGSYALANAVRPEAGLIAVTLLGMAFANQRRVASAHIAEFNEHLGASVLGILFIVLGARVEIADIVDNFAASIAIAAVLILVARPLSVFASTVGTGIAQRDRRFLMSLAPRGVVAAAVASLFEIELDHHDIDAGPLVPVVFTVVAITCLVAGTTARFWAHRLQVARPDPTGVALIGGGLFAIDLAEEFAALQVPTLHVGLSEEGVEEAARRGQLVFAGRMDSHELDDTVGGVGIASAIALSGTDHLNAYALQRLAHLCGRANVFGLGTPDSQADPGLDHGAPSRTVLPEDIDATKLVALHEGGLGLRTVAGPQMADERWLTICVVDADRNVSFSAIASSASPDGHVIQIDALNAHRPVSDTTS